MRVNFLCPLCSRENVYVTGEDPQDFTCEHCQSSVRLEVSESVQQRSVVDRCVLCCKDLFFVQKDFNRKLGCAIVLLGAVASVYTYGACYFCNSVYRGYTPNPKHKGYDLNIGELVESAIRDQKA